MRCIRNEWTAVPAYYFSREKRPNALRLVDPCGQRFRCPHYARLPFVKPYVMSTAFFCSYCERESGINLPWDPGSGIQSRMRWIFRHARSGPSGYLLTSCLHYPSSYGGMEEWEIYWAFTYEILWNSCHYSTLFLNRRNPSRLSLGKVVN